MDLIIFAHPDNQKSHNAAILRYVTSCLNREFRSFEIIDLYADGFDPVLRLTREDQKKTLLVEKYQKLVAKADRLIFISPVWWYNTPAILKGFIDHVFNSGLAHNFVSNSTNSTLHKKLTGKTAVIINTYGRTKQEATDHGSPLELVLDKAVLEFCGVKVTSRVEWFEVKGLGILNPEIAKKIEKALG
ncbi:FMN-dependent NADH-azoreductase [Candidatus Bilamarchaeum dharawalense]|uniref:FMN-dependent NADH-azoreductase n=1 Tax=Candidatus Bilamarchaeum dharawalense TaxID=2885759 RepID=A0A5E4LRK5_9ARCH|nr:FMN-dependent NADH-azoreductase [Candidatus Bilamarchaeum dharawalense]